MTDRHSVDRLLDDARKGLDRLAPEAAYEAAQDGGVIVDIRSRLHSRRRELVLRDISARTKRLLELTDLDQIIEVDTTGTRRCVP